MGGGVGGIGWGWGWGWDRMGWDGIGYCRMRMGMGMGWGWDRMRWDRDRAEIYCTICTVCNKTKSAPIPKKKETPHLT